MFSRMVKSNPQDRPSIEMVFDELQTQHKTVSLEQQMTEPDLDWRKFMHFHFLPVF